MEPPNYNMIVLLLTPCCSKLQAKDNDTKRRHWKWKKMGEEELQARVNGSQTKGALKGALAWGKDTRCKL
jgi:hypothetical protein